MNLQHLGLGQRALALLGIRASDEDSSAAEAVVLVTEGPAATAPDQGEPDGPASNSVENDDMPNDETGAAANTAALEAACAEASASATAAANARWSAVMKDDASKGRVSQATVLLSETSMSAEAIITALSQFPKEANGGDFASRMADVPNPNVRSEANEPAVADRSERSAREEAKARMSARFAK